MEKLIFDSDKPMLVVMVGLPGSGKSTVADNIFIKSTLEDSIRKPIIHSSDALRKELFGSENVQEDPTKVFAELHKRIKENLKDGKDVVFDVTNINKKKRIAFLNELKRIDCNKICVVVMTPYDICIRQDAKRDRVVGDAPIKKMYMNWTPPSQTEGFDSVEYVFNYGDKNVEKEFNVQVLFDRLNNIDQENRHHTLTIGEHCTETMLNVMDDNKRVDRLTVAAMLHDIGKEFTKMRGDDGQCHYYQHHCVSAYDSLFYLNAYGVHKNDMSYISNLIYYHMHPYMSWAQSEKAMVKDKHLLGDMFTDVMKLHDADVKAHQLTHDKNIIENVWKEVHEIER